MPTPISTNRPSICDPSLASCADSPPEAAASAVAPTHTVNLEPVTITGDAGAQALLQRHDASKACVALEKSAALASAAVPVALVDSGFASLIYASVNCGKELRALSECRDEAESLQSSARQVIDDCHDRGGNVRPSVVPNEIICELSR